MLIYRTGTPLSFLFRSAGSALPRAMISGATSALITFVLEAFVPDEYVAALLSHPYPFQPFAYIAAFVLVFRTNNGYDRLAEARALLGRVLCLCREIAQTIACTWPLTPLYEEHEDLGGSMGATAWV